MKKEIRRKWAEEGRGKREKEAGKGEKDRKQKGYLVDTHLSEYLTVEDSESKDRKQKGYGVDTHLSEYLAVEDSE